MRASRKSDSIPTFPPFDSADVGKTFVVDENGALAMGEASGGGSLIIETAYDSSISDYVVTTPEADIVSACENNVPIILKHNGMYFMSNVDVFSFGSVNVYEITFIQTTVDSYTGSVDEKYITVTAGSGSVSLNSNVYSVSKTTSFFECSGINTAGHITTHSDAEYDITYSNFIDKISAEQSIILRVSMYNSAVVYLSLAYFQYNLGSYTFVFSGIDNNNQVITAAITISSSAINNAISIPYDYFGIVSKITLTSDGTNYTSSKPVYLINSASTLEFTNDSYETTIFRIVTYSTSMMIIENPTDHSLYKATGYNSTQFVPYTPST